MTLTIETGGVYLVKNGVGICADLVGVYDRVHDYVAVRFCNPGNHLEWRAEKEVFENKVIGRWGSLKRESWFNHEYIWSKD